MKPTGPDNSAGIKEHRGRRQAVPYGVNDHAASSLGMVGIQRPLHRIEANVAADALRIFVIADDVAVRPAEIMRDDPRKGLT